MLALERLLPSLTPLLLSDTRARRSSIFFYVAHSKQESRLRECPIRSGEGSGYVRNMGKEVLLGERAVPRTMK